MASDVDTGAYVSVGLLARGGMGDVELGVRKTGSFHRLVAIKRLRPEYRDDASFERMFLDEAKIAGLIRHPNVVSVLDVGSDQRGPFLVMEFVEGVTAAQMMTGVAKRGELLPVQLALRITHQVALGLDAAHNSRGPRGEPLGVIHRDISPQNILIGFDGAARLTDFGIAKALGHGGQKTTTGLLKGKVGYMSPEQLRFERPTQSSDLFSLGVVLFELLSAQRLFQGVDTVEVAQRVLSDPTPDIYAVRDDVSPALVELLFELLAKRPASRPKSAKEIAQRLSSMVDECVAEEGTLPLDEFLKKRFTEEQESIREMSATMVREWEARTTLDAQPARTGPGRALLLGIGAISLLAIALSAFFLVRNSDADTPRMAHEADPPPGATTVPSASMAGGVETRADDASIVRDAARVVSALPIDAGPMDSGRAMPPTKSRPRMRRRPRMSRMDRIRALDHAVEF